MAQQILKITNLVAGFEAKKRWLPAIHGVDLALDRGEILGVVGESGSGKTLTALSVMGLLPHGCVVRAGRIEFGGRELTRLGEKDMQAIRGKDISMIFQDPMAALDPVFRCGDQIGEALKAHTGCTPSDARAKALSLMELMGIPHPQRCYQSYPHQLSGGMCQRVMIAIALSSNPQILIADEPTTALDVTVQAKILALLKGLQKQRGMSILLITHDLGVIAQTAHRMAVMYMGEIVESGSVGQVFARPAHPYTQGLMMSIPRLDQSVDRLHAITGNVPPLGVQLPGCRFCPRCPSAQPRCQIAPPPWVHLGDNHMAKCYLSPGKEDERFG